MAADFADAVPGVSGDAVAEALFAVADGDYALGVPVPGDVVDGARDDVVLPLGGAFACAVPDANTTAAVAASDVEAGGGEAGDGRGGGVLGVLGRIGGVVEGAEEDGFVGLLK